MTAQLTFEPIIHVDHDHGFRVDDESLVMTWQTSDDLDDFKSRVYSAWTAIRPSLGTVDVERWRRVKDESSVCGETIVWETTTQDATLTSVASLILRVRKLRTKGVGLKELAKPDTRADHYAYLSELAQNPNGAPARCLACGV